MKARSTVFLSPTEVLCGQPGSLKPKCLLGAVASVSQADSLTGEELHDDWVLGPMPCEAVRKRSHLSPLWWVKGSMDGTFNSSKYSKNRGMDRNALQHTTIACPSFPWSPVVSQGLLSVLFALDPGDCTWGLAQARPQLRPQPLFHFLF